MTQTELINRLIQILNSKELQQSVSEQKLGSEPQRVDRLKNDLSEILRDQALFGDRKEFNLENILKALKPTAVKLVFSKLSKALNSLESGSMEKTVLQYITTELLISKPGTSYILRQLDRDTKVSDLHNIGLNIKELKKNINSNDLNPTKEFIKFLPENYRNKLINDKDIESDIDKAQKLITNSLSNHIHDNRINHEKILKDEGATFNTLCNSLKDLLQKQDPQKPLASLENSISVMRESIIKLVRNELSTENGIEGLAEKIKEEGYDPKIVKFIITHLSQAHPDDKEITESLNKLLVELEKAPDVTTQLGDLYEYVTNLLTGSVYDLGLTMYDYTTSLVQTLLGLGSPQRAKDHPIKWKDTGKPDGTDFGNGNSDNPGVMKNLYQQFTPTSVQKNLAESVKYFHTSVKGGAFDDIPLLNPKTLTYYLGDLADNLHDFFVEPNGQDGLKPDFSNQTWGE